MSFNKSRMARKERRSGLAMQDYLAIPSNLYAYQWHALSTTPEAWWEIGGELIYPNGTTPPYMRHKPTYHTPTYPSCTVCGRAIPTRYQSLREDSAPLLSICKVGHTIERHIIECMAMLYA